MAGPESLHGVSVHGFSESAEAAARLAGALGSSFREIGVHRFPDGESKVTAAPTAGTAVIYRSLDRPNEKLIELFLAAAALRDGGARRLILVAPYLCYMRQDKAFAPGQAVSQRVIAGLLRDAFDAVVTVAPHLHRVRDFAALFPGRDALAVDPAPVMAGLISQNNGDAVLLGPDEESEPLVRGVAALAGPSPGLAWGVATKRRAGDRQVSVELPALSLTGRNVVLIDDMASSGFTLGECARAARLAGARQVDAVVCHALYSDDAAAMLRAAGIASIRSTDSVPHASNAAPLAPLLAGALSPLL